LFFSIIFQTSEIFFDETQCCILAWTGCWREGECTGVCWSSDSYIGSCGPLVVKHQKTNQNHTHPSCCCCCCYCVHTLSRWSSFQQA
jgi:hypothetical protein